MNKFLSYISVIIAISYSNAQQPIYNLYYTDMTTTDLSHDCLYFVDEQLSEEDITKTLIEQTIEYCFRPLVKENDIINELAISSVLTFDEMKKKNITAKNLIEWSSPVDLVERYENYLQTNKSSLNDVFYKCIEPWFGRFCQYSFDLNQTFINIVTVQFYWKPTIHTHSNYTCYMHMKCARYSPLSCLEWRDICDGKIDCINSEDEQNCFELEMNKCSENEYQCINGMCVDEAFLSDDPYDMRSPECLDGSDEALVINDPLCAIYSYFSCEDVAYQYSERLSCGDGTHFQSVLPRSIFLCKNKRDITFNFVVNWNNRNDTRFPYCFRLRWCASRGQSSYAFNRYCKSLCQSRQECEIKTVQSCASSFIAPTFPVWDNHVRLGYFANRTNSINAYVKPHFVCYDQTRCPFLIPTFILENYTCIHIHLLSNLSNMDDLILKFIPCHRPDQSANEAHCLQPNMLRCPQTDKCIPHRRIMDGIPDCYNAFDESRVSNSCVLKDKYRFNCTSENHCLSPVLEDNEQSNCIRGEDEHYIISEIMNIQQLPFSAICDSWTDMVNLDNNTDETHCGEQWPCSNQYTRCNQAWNCRKGEDELNCSSKFQCPPNHHPCLFPNDLKMSCLHINNVDDGIVDCLGASDERSYCRSMNVTRRLYRRCWNSTTCLLTEDFCFACDTISNIGHLCQQSSEEAADIIYYLQSSNDAFIVTKPRFSHTSSHSFPPIQIQPPDDEHDQQEPIDISEDPIYDSMDDRDIWLCNRGILIRIGNDKTPGCLCTPNYYGNHCEYQNQRISLTLRFRKENFQRLDVVGIVIRLIDHTGFIHSHDQLTYIPLVDCGTKFNLHLLYQTRPKDMTKNYTIDIDAYDKINLIYLMTWTLSVPFLFMPVNRVSAQLTIPVQRNCSLLCQHKYPASLKPVDLDSCDCKLNLSNIISDEYSCSSDSINVGFAHNRSICLCPLNKTGPRCFIKSICENQTCKNGGICVPYDVRTSFTDLVCVCPEGYSGDRCEQKEVSIFISFSDLEITEYLLFHYITISEDYLARKSTKVPRATMFKKIPYHLNTINVNMSLPFHLLFVQLIDLYYLILLQHNYTSSAKFSTQISPSNHCPHIRTLFDEQILKYSILHRVKYYHTICKNYSNLVCFHDQEEFMCLCTEERHANCFHFNFNMTYDCHGENLCENGGKCYQDHPRCPTMELCECEECFYGGKCQLHAKHLGVTLDSIIGYHIYPNFPFNQQSASVKISISIVIVMFVIVLISGILSIWTFQLKTCQETGSGIYLYMSSIISIMTIIILNLKVYFLILSQMNIITSKGFLWFNCITIDFLLRSSLAFIDWLHASVAIERLLVAFLGINFNKKKSKKTAKRVIIIIIVLISLSLIHDPIHRRLFEDAEEERTWCLARYTSSVRIYDTIISIIHFIIPLSVNILSAIGVITFTTKQRAKGKTEDTFMTHLKQQFDHHKHLLISSFLLVILALPRLIISFLSNCMKSPREYKLYLAGYFISFIPALLTFFIFILTSSKYKKECHTQTIQKWTVFKRRLNFS